MAALKQTILFVLALVPVVIGNSIDNHDGFEQGAGRNDDIVQFLVQEIQDLKVTVKGQNERIENLEARLRLAEDQLNDKSETQSKEEISETGNENVAQLDTSAIASDNGTAAAEDSLAEDMPSRIVQDRHSRDDAAPITGLIGPFGRGRGLAFSVYLDRTVSNLNQGATVRFNREFVDDENVYNPSTGVFTAPNSGVYFFSFFIEDHTQRTPVRLMVDGVAKVHAIFEPYRPGAQAISAGNSAILRVQEGQTVWIESYQHVGTFFGEQTGHFCTFSGFLIY